MIFGSDLLGSHLIVCWWNRKTLNHPSKRGSFPAPFAVHEKCWLLGWLECSALSCSWEKSPLDSPVGSKDDTQGRAAKGARHIGRNLWTWVLPIWRLSRRRWSQDESKDNCWLHLDFNPKNPDFSTNTLAFISCGR